MKLTVGHQSDPGPRKGGNQDSVLAVVSEQRPDMALLIVADGMGGARGGEHASQQAVAVIQQHLLEGEELTAAQAGARLRDAIVAANTAIHQMGMSTPEMEGMGCTVVVALLLEGSYWVASAGDSRAYLIRDGRGQQLTRDHTWVSQQVRNGVLTADQAARHSLRHVLDRALGADQTIEVDVWPDARLQPRDTLLLCTDGLYGVLSDDTLVEVASQHPPQEAADRLLKLALSAPARDNVSVVIVRAE